LPRLSERNRASAADQKERGAEQINKISPRGATCARDDYFDQQGDHALSSLDICANCVIVLLPRGVIRRSLTEIVCVCVYYLMRATAKCCTPAGVIALDVYSMTFHNAPATATAAAWYNINTKIQRTFIWMHTHRHQERTSAAAHSIVQARKE